jgi:hypothetical protein
MRKYLKTKLEHLLIAIAVCFGVIAVSGIAWVLFITATEMHVHLQMYEDVQQQLGFRYETPYLEGGGEALILTEISEGGIMDRAGFKQGDRYDTVGGLVIPFINLFVFHQGNQTVVPILRNDEHVEIPVDVPQLKLDVDPQKLRYPFTRYRE